MCGREGRSFGQLPQLVSKLGNIENVSDLQKKSAVKLIKSGQVEVKNDKDGNLALSIGKKNFDDKKLKENYDTVIQTLKKDKPKGITHIIHIILKCPTGNDCRN